MRTRILKLDGLQKSLTITAINHPGTSIFGWRRLCRQQKCKAKAQEEKGCHSGVRIVPRVKEAAGVRRFQKQIPPTTVTLVKTHGALPRTARDTGAKANRTIFLGSLLVLQRTSARSTRVPLSPLSVTPLAFR